MTQSEINEIWITAYGHYLSRFMSRGDNTNQRSQARQRAADEADMTIETLRMSPRNSPGDEF